MEFDKLCELYNGQVNALRQIRADYLTSSGNWSKLLQSLAASSEGVRAGMAAGGVKVDQAGETLARNLAEAQSSLLNSVYRTTEGQIKDRVLAPIDDELLRARDVFFRLETLRRIHMEVESLRPRASQPQVSQYIREKRVEYEAITQGLRETMTASLSRRKILFESLLPAMAHAEIQFFRDAATRLEAALNNAAHVDPPAGQETPPKASIAREAGDVEGHAMPVEEDASAQAAEDPKGAVDVAPDLSGEHAGSVNHAPVQLNEELRRREEINAQQKVEVRERANEKLAEVTEREEAERQEKEELRSAKERLEPIISEWTMRGQFRGNLMRLLAGLEQLLGEEWNWKPVSWEKLQEPSRAKAAYFKAILILHPDKHVGKDTDTRALGELVFDELQNAWQVTCAEQEGKPPPPGSVGPKQPNFGQHNEAANSYPTGGVANAAGMDPSMMAGMGYGNMGYGMQGMQMPGMQQGYGMYGGMGYGGMAGMNQGYGMGYGMGAGNMAGMHASRMQQMQQNLQQQNAQQQQYQQQQQQFR